MSQPWADPANYVAPPPFAPPEARVPPLDPSSPFVRFGYYPDARLAPFTPGRPGRPGRPGFGARTRPAVVVGWLVSAVLLAGVLVGIVNVTSTDQRSLSLPQQVGDYVQLRALTGPQIASALGGALSGLEASALDTAKIGIYGVQGSSATELVFIGLEGKDDTELGSELQAQSSDAVVADVIEGAEGTSVQSSFAGLLGGALSCAQLEQDGDVLSLGVWADRSTLGLVMILGQVSAAHTGEMTRTFRAAAEH